MSDSLDIENGVLSFANPNYHLAPSDVNSNTENITNIDSPDEEYEELYEELDSVCRFSRKPTIQSRRSYAKLDTVSMGVDLNTDLSLVLENKQILPDVENNIDSKASVDAISSGETQQVPISESNNNTNINSDDSKNLDSSMGRRSGFLEYYINLEAAVRQRKETAPLTQNDQTKCSRQWSRPSTPERDSGHDGSLKSSSIVEEYAVDVPHFHGGVTDDLYAVPVKKNHQKIEYKKDEQKVNASISIPLTESQTSNEKHFYNKDHRSDDDGNLPSGWEKHEDDCGPYYWHISSGTIQREPPSPLLPNHKLHSKQFSRDLDMISGISDFSLPSSKPSSPPASDMHYNICNTHNIDSELKRRSFTEGTCSLTPDKKPIRFAVRSLGWVEIAEEDLTPERSSKAVNKCIVDLSLGRNDILDVVGRWGDPCGMWQGKDLFMDLDDYCLQLTDPQDLTVLNTQPIHTIRVWGVGRDNGRERDFAYVARDRVTRKHMCHVFRCDIPARIIANTLRDICKKIMIERSLHHSLPKPVSSGPQGVNTKGAPARPTNLPTEQRRFYHDDISPGSYSAQSFPTPMEEPKKILKVHYLGTIQVIRPVGMEVLNSAIDTLVAALPPSQYKFVNVAVAPSTITISDPGDGKQLAECRVRFLSFLGIGRNVKHCAFIMHTAQDQFIGHVFYCEPSSGALCKTIEAACKLRYQKCLDAHKQVLEKKNSEAQENKDAPTMRHHH